jgi:hypothetical protein
MEAEGQNHIESQLIKQVSAPLFSARGWMKLVGIILIITGVIQALSIVGLLVAWIPIWMGIMVTSAANRMDAAYREGDKYSFIEAQTKLGSYFTVFGVLLLIGLILTALLIITAISSGFLVEYITNIEQSMY